MAGGAPQGRCAGPLDHDRRDSQTSNFDAPNQTLVHDRPRNQDAEDIVLAQDEVLGTGERGLGPE